MCLLCLQFSFVQNFFENTMIDSNIPVFDLADVQKVTEIKHAMLMFVTHICNNTSLNE